MNTHFQSSAFGSPITSVICDTHDNVSLDSPQETGSPDHFSSMSANLRVGTHQLMSENKLAECYFGGGCQPAVLPASPNLLFSLVAL